MSGIFRSIVNFFFPRGSQAEPQAEATHRTKDDVDDHDDGWSQFEPFKCVDGVIEGDASSGGSGDRYDECGTRGKPHWETNSITYGYREYPPPENLQSAIDYQWEYDNGEFTDLIIKATGKEKLGQKCDVAPVCEKKSLDRANDAEISEEDDVKPGDRYPADEKRDADSGTTNPEESLPILPDLTSDESSDDDGLKIEDPSFQKEMQNGEGGELPSETSACSHENGGLLASAYLPSMPDLESLGEVVTTQVTPAVPLDETHACQSESVHLGTPGFSNIARSIVLSQGRSTTPVNEKRGIEASSSIPKSDVHAQTITSLRAVTLEEMYQRFNREKMPIPYQLNRSISPGKLTEILMDVDRRSRIVYQPESNSMKTPPNSPESMADTTFHTADSRVSAAGNNSPGPLTPSHCPPSSRNPYLVRMLSKDNTAAVAASPNEKFKLVKSKVDSGLPKARVCSFTLVAPAHSKTVEKKDEIRDGFVTPKSSGSKNPRKMSATTTWTGTPRPASKAPNSSLAGVAVAHPRKPGDQRKDQNYVTPKATSKFEPKIPSNQTSRDGKRNRSDGKTQDHAPSKKRKVDIRPNATPARPLRSRIPSSILNSPRSMRRRNPSVVYKG